MLINAHGFILATLHSIVRTLFMAREVIPYYAVFPHVGRMDDIWGGYVAQLKFPQSVVYNKASVYQDRNVQDLVTNLEKEIIGYRYYTQSLLLRSKSLEVICSRRNY